MGTVEAERLSDLNSTCGGKAPKVHLGSGKLPWASSIGETSLWASSTKKVLHWASSIKKGPPRESSTEEGAPQTSPTEEGPLQTISIGRDGMVSVNAWASRDESCSGVGGAGRLIPGLGTESKTTRVYIKA
ncbi:unnamed protein product, partial [Ilex paraguariensis]